MLMDVNVPAAERALIQRRLLNMSKPKTAGANRNMGKKKLSTVPPNIQNQRIISGSGVSAHGMFFEKPARQEPGSHLQTLKAAHIPESALLSVRQPGESESQSKTLQGSQLPTMTRSYSVWKENFAIRKDIGYDTYKRLPKEEINQIMHQLHSEHNLHKRRARQSKTKVTLQEDTEGKMHEVASGEDEAAEAGESGSLGSGEDQEEQQEGEAGVPEGET